MSAHDTPRPYNSNYNSTKFGSQIGVWHNMCGLRTEPLHSLRSGVGYTHLVKVRQGESGSGKVWLANHTGSVQPTTHSFRVGSGSPWLAGYTDIMQISVDQCRCM
jgi:hypothetical protein